MWLIVGLRSSTLCGSLLLADWLATPFPCTLLNELTALHLLASLWTVKVVLHSEICVTLDSDKDTIVWTWFHFVHSIWTVFIVLELFFF